MNRFIPLVVISLIFGSFIYYFYQDDTVNTNFTETQSETYEVLGQDIEYFEGYKGFLARPNDQKNYPGIIMIHEWWGLNENIKDKAKELAEEGYIVLAVDLFGTVATTPEEARIQSSSLDQTKALANMQSAKSYLVQEGAPKIASLGWCFGGAQSLQISITEKLDATVIYYGNLVEDTEKLKNLSSPVLGIFGDQDAQIPVEKVNNFKNNLNNLSILNDIYIYEGVGHAFANPSGQNFSPNETADAWSKTLNFLETNLK
jgi:carboxymethylenebutenolidase